MTVEERAEKIVLELQHFANATEKEKIIFAAAEIKAAVEDRQIVSAWDAVEFILVAKAEAYEDAAKTMSEGAKMYQGNKFLVHLFESLANRFRAKAKGLK